MEEDLYSSEHISRRKMNNPTATVIAAAVIFFLLGVLCCLLVLMVRFPGLLSVNRAMELIRSEFFYYDRDITEENIRTGALKGIASYLEDDYAAYYTDTEYQELLSGESGQSIGIGVLVEKKDTGLFYISEVYADTPAARAGLCAGDRLLQVNGTVTEGLSLSELVEAFNTEDGGENRITVLRDEQTYSFSVQAEVIYYPYARYEMLDNDIGYIAISAFHGRVTEEVRDAVDSLLADGMRKLIIDVRDNLGGNFYDVTAIADIFLPQDRVITTLKSRKGRESVYKTEKDGMDIPICVLVNRNSASASELLAAALRDNGMAVLIGEKTYGKGIVQTYYSLSGEGGTVKLTTDAYYTPAGVCIQGNGLSPDMEVILPDGLSELPVDQLKQEEDLQLAAAMDYLAENTCD